MISRRWSERIWAFGFILLLVMAAGGGVYAVEDLRAKPHHHS